MAGEPMASPGLAFPRDTFARLTPGPFLHAHLRQAHAARPNGRSPAEFRKPTVNHGSLTHANGSAVVRSGDTAIVCGVRAEVLLASDIPHPPDDQVGEDDLVEHLGLLVPNLELSTGCSPKFLPGNPPGAIAQTLSYRILSLLHTSQLLNVRDLKIEYTDSRSDDDVPDSGPRTTTKAYWTLYIDILCIALDGNAFDTAWTAVIAALQNTILPEAWWDPDQQMIVCSRRVSEGATLRLNGLPMAATFAVFSTASALRSDEEAASWVLADPDSFEESVSTGALTVVASQGRANDGNGGLLRLEQSSSGTIQRLPLAQCVRLAEKWRTPWEAALRAD